MQTGYWPVPFFGDEALQIGELLLSKPVGYMERKFGEFFPLALDLLQNTLQIYSFSIYC